MSDRSVMSSRFISNFYGQENVDEMKHFNRARNYFIIEDNFTSINDDKQLFKLTYSSMLIKGPYFQIIQLNKLYEYIISIKC